MFGGGEYICFVEILLVSQCLEEILLVGQMFGIYNVWWR